MLNSELMRHLREPPLIVSEGSDGHRNASEHIGGWVHLAERYHCETY